MKFLLVLTGFSGLSLEVLRFDIFGILSCGQFVVGVLNVQGHHPKVPIYICHCNFVLLGQHHDKTCLSVVWFISSNWR